MAADTSKDRKRGLAGLKIVPVRRVPILVRVGD